MRSAWKVVAAATVLAAGGIAVAGSSWAADSGGSGFPCQNMCPLARKANEHRSFGTEGSVAKQALAAQVQRNLAKV